MTAVAARSTLARNAPAIRSAALASFAVASISAPAASSIAESCQSSAASAPRWASRCGSAGHAAPSASAMRTSPRAPAQHAAGPHAPCQKPGRDRYQPSPPIRASVGSATSLKYVAPVHVEANAGARHTPRSATMPSALRSTSTSHRAEPQRAWTSARSMRPTPEQNGRPPSRTILPSLSRTSSRRSPSSAAHTPYTA